MLRSLWWETTETTMNVVEDLVEWWTEKRGYLIFFFLSFAYLYFAWIANTPFGLFEIVAFSIWLLAALTASQDQRIQDDQQVRGGDRMITSRHAEEGTFVGRFVDAWRIVGFFAFFVFVASLVAATVQFVLGVRGADLALTLTLTLTSGAVWLVRQWLNRGHDHYGQRSSFETTLVEWAYDRGMLALSWAWILSAISAPLSAVVLAAGLVWLPFNGPGWLPVGSAAVLVVSVGILVLGSKTMPDPESRS